MPQPDYWSLLISQADSTPITTLFIIISLSFRPGQPRPLQTGHWMRLVPIPNLRQKNLFYCTDRGPLLALLCLQSWPSYPIRVTWSPRLLPPLSDVGHMHIRSPNWPMLASKQIVSSMPLLPIPHRRSQVTALSSTGRVSIPMHPWNLNLFLRCWFSPYTNTLSEEICLKCDTVRVRHWRSRWTCLCILWEKSMMNSRRLVEELGG